MDRRKFFSVTGAGAAAVAAGAVPAAEAASKKAAMGGSCASARLQPLKARLGHQMNGHLNELQLRLGGALRPGCHLRQPDPGRSHRLYPTVDELNAMQDQANKWKLKVEVIDSILLTSSNVDREKHPGHRAGPVAGA